MANTAPLSTVAIAQGPSQSSLNRLPRCRLNWALACKLSHSGASCA